MTTSLEIMWIAALLEGEGCFRLSNGYPRIHLVMTDLDTIEKFRIITKTTGTKMLVKPYEKWKTRYDTTINGTLAIQWMMTIYPLMGIRRKEKIKSLLDTWKNHITKHVRRPEVGKMLGKKFSNAVTAYMITKGVSREIATDVMEKWLNGTKTVQ